MPSLTALPAEVDLKRIRNDNGRIMLMEQIIGIMIGVVLGLFVGFMAGQMVEYYQAKNDFSSRHESYAACLQGRFSGLLDSIDSGPS